MALLLFRGAFPGRAQAVPDLKAVQISIYGKIRTNLRRAEDGRWENGGERSDKLCEKKWDKWRKGKELVNIVQNYKGESRGFLTDNTNLFLIKTKNSTEYGKIVHYFLQKPNVKEEEREEM